MSSSSSSGYLVEGSSGSKGFQPTGGSSQSLMKFNFDWIQRRCFKGGQYHSPPRFALLGHRDFACCRTYHYCEAIIFEPNISIVVFDGVPVQTYHH